MANVFISHHMDEIFEIGDRITVLRDGKVASTGPVTGYDHDKAVRSMVGRSIENQRKNRTASVGKTVLDVRGLSSGRRVQDVTFEVRAGEIVGAWRIGVANIIINLSGVSPYLQGTLKGSIILIAVALSQFNFKAIRSGR